MKLSEIKKRYTEIKKDKDQFGRSFYYLMLIVDHQSFMVGKYHADIVSAKWYQGQLVKALKRLLLAFSKR